MSSRDRLLDVALSLFASRGYAATSTAEIQQACGMSPSSGALYTHFRHHPPIDHEIRQPSAHHRTSSPTDQAPTCNEHRRPILALANPTNLELR